MDFGRDKRILIYIRYVSGVPTIILKKRISSKVSQAGLKGKLFPFSVSKPSYRRGSTFFYFFDVDSGQMSFKKTDLVISPQLMDSIFRKEIAKQLSSSLQTNTWGNIMMLLLGILIGVAFGYIIGNAIPL